MKIRLFAFSCCSTLLALSATGVEVHIPRVAEELAGYDLSDSSFCPTVYLFKQPMAAALLAAGSQISEEDLVRNLLYQPVLPPLAPHIAVQQQLYFSTVYAQLQANTIYAVRSQSEKADFVARIPAIAGYVYSAYRQGAWFFIGEGEAGAAGSPVALVWRKVPVLGLAQGDAGRPVGFSLHRSVPYWRDSNPALAATPADPDSPEALQDERSQAAARQFREQYPSKPATGQPGGAASLPIFSLAARLQQASAATRAQGITAETVARSIERTDITYLMARENISLGQFIQKAEANPQLAGLIKAKYNTSVAEHIQSLFPKS